MDFKSLMSKQISKSKSSSTSITTNGTSKYQRKAEAEKEREANYKEEQARLEIEKQQKSGKKRKLEEEEIERNLLREEKRRKLAEESKVRREAQEAEEERLKRKRLGLPELLKDGEEQLPYIPDDELRTKLVELKEEESLHDTETHEERLARYHKVIKALKRKKTWYPGPIPTTIEPVPADELILPAKPSSADDVDAYVKIHRQIATYLNFVLTEWSSALNGRSEEDAQGSAGIAATNNYKTALDDLKPLMRRLETGVQSIQGLQTSSTYQPLPHTALLTPLVEILHLTQKRHYRDAVDAYLRLSIGKAAWPIGVTMVGIHERSAREKLHEDKKGDGGETAQIMTDESTRKWLQSLKRCVSFAQTRWEVWDVGQLMG